MHGSNDHDHSHMSHSAKCDDCDYLAKVHAHDEESAVDSLAKDLSGHNKSEHGKDDDPEEIKDAVRAKVVIG